jgi:hypothetical protein
MLERIRKILKTLAYLQHPKMPRELNSKYTISWPTADSSFESAISTLRDREQRSRLMPLLEAAGLTGTMLEMKETSLNYHLDRIEKEIPKSPKEKKKSKWKKFVKWIKPGFTVMNSIMGSLLSSIPGIECAKEYKEHVEAGYEVVETALDD